MKLLHFLTVLFTFLIIFSIIQIVNFKEPYICPRKSSFLRRLFSCTLKITKILFFQKFVFCKFADSIKKILKKKKLQQYSYHV